MPRTELKVKLQERIALGAPRGVWTPVDFLDLGNREAVDKTLQRLVNTGNLRRIDRGLYDCPADNHLTCKPNPADPRAVIDAVSRRDQVRILVDGMTAANDLGLTNAVPAKIVVHTDARLRPIHIGALDIVFRPTAASKLYWAGRPAMRIVQALHWLRDTLDTEGETETVLRRLRNLLADPEQGDALRQDLGDGLSTLPAWMQDTIKAALTTEEVPPRSANASPASKATAAAAQA